VKYPEPGTAYVPVPSGHVTSIVPMLLLSKEEIRQFTQEASGFSKPEGDDGDGQAAINYDGGPR
jgi:hypothetical protein